jgi:hypothetical protein
VQFLKQLLTGHPQALLACRACTHNHCSDYNGTSVNRPNKFLVQALHVHIHYDAKRVIELPTVLSTTVTRYDSTRSRAAGQQSSCCFINRSCKPLQAVVQQSCKYALLQAFAQLSASNSSRWLSCKLSCKQLLRVPYCCFAAGGCPDSSSSSICAASCCSEGAAAAAGVLPAAAGASKEIRSSAAGSKQQQYSSSTEAGKCNQHSQRGVGLWPYRSAEYEGQRMVKHMNCMEKGWRQAASAAAK